MYDIDIGSRARSIYISDNNLKASTTAIFGYESNTMKEGLVEELDKG